MRTSSTSTTTNTTIPKPTRISQPDRAFESVLANATKESRSGQGGVSADAENADKTGPDTGTFSTSLETKGNQQSTSAGTRGNQETNVLKITPQEQDTDKLSSKQSSEPGSAELKSSQKNSARAGDGRDAAANQNNATTAQDTQPQAEIASGNYFAAASDGTVSSAWNGAAFDGVSAAGADGAQCSDKSLEPAGVSAKSATANEPGTADGSGLQFGLVTVGTGCSITESSATQGASGIGLEGSVPQPGGLPGDSGRPSMDLMGAQGLEGASPVPMAAASNLDMASLLGKGSTQANSFNQAGAGNSTAATTASSGAGKISAATLGNHDASLHSFVNTSTIVQDSQAPQAAQSQTASAALGTATTHAPQQQMPGQATTGTATRHAGQDGAGAGQSTNGSEVGSSSDDIDVRQSSGINTARLIQSVGQTEMRVGIQSSEFGSISIRSSLAQNVMHTQISLPHADLSHAILAQVPTLEAKLGNEQGLRAHIEVNNMAGGGSEQSSQREPRASAASTSWQTNERSTDSGPVMGLESLLGAAGTHLLDIVA